MTPFILFAIACGPGEAATEAGGCPAAELRDNAGVCVPAACGAAIPEGDVTVSPGESIQDAADHLGSGVLVLGAGTWKETLVFDEAHDGLTLAGRCPALTIIDGSDAADTLTTIELDVRRQQAFTLRDFTVTGGTDGGIGGSAPDATLERLWILNNQTFGIAIEGAGTVDMRDIRVSETRSGPRGTFGIGLAFSGGATVAGERVVVLESQETGIYVAGADVTLTDVEVGDTRAADDGYGGYGIYLSGGSLSLERARVHHNVEVGVLVDSGGSLALHDVEIADTMPAAARQGGYGLFLLDNAMGDADGLTLRGNTGYGAVAVGATLAIRNALVEGTLHSPDDGKATGVDAQGLATVSVSSSVIRGNDGAGVTAFGAGTSVALHGVLVENGGRGAEIASGATLSATSCTFTGGRGTGIAVSDVGTHVHLTDVAIAETQTVDGVAGEGLFVQQGAVATLASVRLSQNHRAAVVVTGTGSIIQGANVTVTSTQSMENGEGGLGLLADDGGTLDLTGAWVRDSIQYGVAAARGGSVLLRDCAISGVRHDDLSAEAGTVTGGGVVAILGSNLRLERCTIGNTEALGVGVSGVGSTAFLTDLAITGILPSVTVAQGHGLAIGDGGRVLASRVRIEGANGAGVVVSGADTALTATDLNVGHARAAAIGSGGAIEIGDRATATLARVHVTDQQGHAVFADLGASVAIDALRVQAMRPSARYADVIAVIAQRDAHIEISDLTMTDVSGPGLSATEGGSIVCTGCSIEHAAFAGVVAFGGSIDLRGCRIANTAADVSKGGGLGVYANGWGGRTALSLSDCEVSGSPVAAVWLEGDVRALIADSALNGGPGWALREGLLLHGNALYARDTPSDAVVLARTTLSGSAVAALLDGGTASFSDMVWLENTVDLVQQRCEGVALPTGASAPTTLGCPESDLPTLNLYYDPGLVEPVAASE